MVRGTARNTRTGGEASKQGRRDGPQRLNQSQDEDETRGQRNIHTYM